MTDFLNKARTFQWGVGLFIIILAICTLYFFISEFWPLGVDYYYTYHEVTAKWLNGETHLYDSNSQGFYNLPWLLVLLIPLHLLPLPVGNTILILLSLLAIITAIILLGELKHPLFIILSLLNPFVFDLLFIRAQIDAFVLLGVALGYVAIKRQYPWLLSLAFLLLTLKPLNVLLIIILFIYASRHWRVSLWLKTLILPILFTISFGFISGFDWPGRYFYFLFSHSPLERYSEFLTTLWQSFQQFGLPWWPIIILGIVAVVGLIFLIKNVGVNQWSLNLTLATNLVFTPYALGYHYILLIPVFLWLINRRWQLGFFIYLFTWVSVLHQFTGLNTNGFAILYPILLLLALWWLLINKNIKELTRVSS